VVSGGCSGVLVMDHNALLCNTCLSMAQFNYTRLRSIDVGRPMIAGPCVSVT
jgi:hypothetical protein